MKTKYESGKIWNVGDTATFTKTMTETDVILWVGFDR